MEVVVAEVGELVVADGTGAGGWGGGVVEALYGVLEGVEGGEGGGVFGAEDAGAVRGLHLRCGWILCGVVVRWWRRWRGRSVIGTRRIEVFGVAEGRHGGGIEAVEWA